MSDKLREQLELERRLLHRQVDELRTVLGVCETRAPTPIERTAMAAMLNGFYNGIENVFKRIAVAYDGGVPGGIASHRDLLDLMARGTPDRPRVVSESLRDALDPYLDFRHRLHHAYSFHLDWPKMEGLVTECEAVLARFDAEIAAFLDVIEKGT